LSGIVGVNALGNFNDGIVGEFSSNSSDLIFFELDFLISIGIISLLLGPSLLGSTLMGIVYLLTLGYLFLGIAIVSDIFMEAIEEITA